MSPLHALGRGLSMAVAVAGILCFAGFVQQLPNATQESGPLDAMDGIVVPTGGYARVATGLDLLHHGAGRLLITGVYPDTPLSAVLLETDRRRPACCVDLDYAAANTADNAVAAAKWEKQYNFQRIHLVTSWYHMPRSLLLFHRALPGITIVPHPVFPQHWADKPWWITWDGWRLVGIEFGKYVWAWILLTVDRNG